MTFELSQFVNVLVGVVSILVVAIGLLFAQRWFASSNRQHRDDHDIQHLERRLEEIQDEERRIIRQIIDAKSAGEAAE